MKPYLPAKNEGEPSAAQREVTELHQFFEDWIRGTLAATNEAFARFEGALDPHFEIVPPSGARLDRVEILKRVRTAHGSHRERPAPYRIEVKNVRSRALGEGFHLVAYEEWQTEGTTTRGRLSTALLREDANAPGGFVWIHVHETWMPGGGSG